IAGDLLAVRARSCVGGAPSTWRKLVDLEGYCDAAAAGVAEGRIAFDPDAFGACQRGLPSLSCELLDTGDLLYGCAAFRPQVAPGGACAHRSDCADGFCDTSSTCPGTCVAWVPPGGECGAGTSCRPGSTCVDTGEGLA